MYYLKVCDSELAAYWMIKLRMGLELKKKSRKLQIEKEILQRKIDRTKERYLQGAVRERKKAIRKHNMKKKWNR